MPQSIRRAVIALASAQGLLFAALGLARWATFHNETFDLAFYTRIAWGFAHNDHWEPMVNAHFLGLHISPVLAPIGLLGMLLGTTPLLIVAQAAALAAATVPLARIGVRHLGPRGAVIGAIAWLFHPNLGHVAGYEAHPGALAALPLAWMAWAIDRGSARGFILAALGALACREDLALVTALAAVLFFWRHRDHRRAAIGVGLGSLAYALLFFLVLHPRFAPATGSLELHFGRFGDSTTEVALYLLTHPLELASHLATPARLTYLPRVLAPLALLTLARPAWLLPVAPILAINLISEWPTTTSLEVQYLTPALPFLVAGALEGATLRADRLSIRVLGGVLVAAAFLGHVIAGGTPLSIGFDASAFRPDPDTLAARAIVAAIPPDASVQAPDALLSHLAERRHLRRAASAEAGFDYLVLDVEHRRRFAANEDLLRTIEEPKTRTWLGRDDHRVVLGAGRYLLLERGHHPREGAGADAIVGRADPSAGAPIASCLSVLGARLDGDVLTLDLVARGPCPNDLAIRIGTGERPRRVDLLFGGWLSPRHLRSGDHVQSRHRLSEAELTRIAREGLRVGALRSSGARPEHADPTSIPVPLTTSGAGRRR